MVVTAQMRLSGPDRELGRLWRLEGLEAWRAWVTVRRVSKAARKASEGLKSSWVGSWGWGGKECSWLKRTSMRLKWANLRLNGPS